MVNTESMDAANDANATERVTQLNTAPADAHSSSPVTAPVLCLSFGGQSVSNSEFETSSTPESAGDTSIDITTLCCSVPLVKLQDISLETKKKVSNKKFLCLYCDRTFVTTSLRQKHVDRCHSAKQARRSSSRFQSKTPTVCIYCKKLNNSDHSLNDLFRHLVEKHPNKYFACLECEERFSFRSLLDEHNLETHNFNSSRQQRNFLENAFEDDRFRTKHKARKKEEKEIEEKSTMRLRKELRKRKVAVKSTKSGVKKQPPPTKTRKRKKAAENEEKEKNCINPYPTFDAFFRVKKITDHSIDNLKISSLTFDDVFDKAFFTRIKCNIQENLQNHIDGKLFNNEESENRISNFEKMQEANNTLSENFGCDLTLNAATPVVSLLSSQLGEDLESQIEYGAKASKKKVPVKKDEVHYKYFTRRKYQASILENKENRDLSKLDMWTQLLVKDRQQKIINDQKSDKEKIEYTKGIEYKTKMQNDELNRILDRRGPFEDLKEEANKMAALEKMNRLGESASHVSSILDEIFNMVFEKEIKMEIEISEKSDKSDSSLSGCVSEIPFYLNLQRTSLQEEDIDRSDKITLICSSQETENFELTQTPRDKNTLVELTGEWARTRLYICAACGAKLSNMKLLLDHKGVYHPNVWVQHYEFVGNQSELYKHLSIPGLGKVGHMEEHPVIKAWKRSDARSCTKCSKVCNSLAELHRHMLECGEDWSWMLARKKLKYRPFGSKSRKKRRGLVKRIIHKETVDGEPRPKRKYNVKPKHDGPRQRPSDAETIQRMLANLPAKRATRKLISLKEGISKPRRKQIVPTPVENKPNRKPKKKVKQQKSASLVSKTAKCNPVIIRKSVRNINKVLASKVLDTSSTIRVKRKLKSALQIRTRNRAEEIKSDPEEDVKVSLLNKVKMIGKNVKKRVFKSSDNKKVKTNSESENVSVNIPETHQNETQEEPQKESLGSRIARSLSMKRSKKLEETPHEKKSTLNVFKNKSKKLKVKEKRITKIAQVDGSSQISDEILPFLENFHLEERENDRPNVCISISQPDVTIEKTIEAQTFEDISANLGQVISSNLPEENYQSNEKNEDCSKSKTEHKSQPQTDIFNIENNTEIAKEDTSKIVEETTLNNTTESENAQEKVQINTEQDSTDNIIDETDSCDKQEVVRKEPPQQKLSESLNKKSKKKFKGLNDCIAMLTSKLQQKSDHNITENFTSTQTQNNSESKTEHPIKNKPEESETCLDLSLNNRNHEVENSSIINDQPAKNSVQNDFPSPNLNIPQHNHSTSPIKKPILKNIFPPLFNMPPKLPQPFLPLIHNFFPNLLLSNPYFTDQFRKLQEPVMPASQPAKPVILNVPNLNFNKHFEKQRGVVGNSSLKNVTKENISRNKNKTVLNTPQIDTKKDSQNNKNQEESLNSEGNVKSNPTENIIINNHVIETKNLVVEGTTLENNLKIMDEHDDPKKAEFFESLQMNSIGEYKRIDETEKIEENIFEKINAEPNILSFKNIILNNIDKLEKPFKDDELIKKFKEVDVNIEVKNMEKVLDFPMKTEKSQVTTETKRRQRRNARKRFSRKRKENINLMLIDESEQNRDKDKELSLEIENTLEDLKANVDKLNSVTEVSETIESAQSSIHDQTQSSNSKENSETKEVLTSITVPMETVEGTPTKQLRRRSNSKKKQKNPQEEASESKIEECESDFLNIDSAIDDIIKSVDRKINSKKRRDKLAEVREDTYNFEEESTRNSTSSKSSRSKRGRKTKPNETMDIGLEFQMFLDAHESDILENKAFLENLSSKRDDQKNDVEQNGTDSEDDVPLAFLFKDRKNRKSDDTKFGENKEINEDIKKCGSDHQLNEIEEITRNTRCGRLRKRTGKIREKSVNNLESGVSIDENKKMEEEENTVILRDSLEKSLTKIDGEPIVFVDENVAIKGGKMDLDKEKTNLERDGMNLNKEGIIINAENESSETKIITNQANAEVKKLNEKVVRDEEKMIINEDHGSLNNNNLKRVVILQQNEAWHEISGNDESLNKETLNDKLIASKMSLCKEEAFTLDKTIPNLDSARGDPRVNVDNQIILKDKEINVNNEEECATEDDVNISEINQSGLETSSNKGTGSLSRNTMRFNRDELDSNRDNISLDRDEINLNKDQINSNGNQINLNRDKINWSDVETYLNSVQTNLNENIIELNKHEVTLAAQIINSKDETNISQKEINSKGDEIIRNEEMPSFHNEKNKVKTGEELNFIENGINREERLFYIEPKTLETFETAITKEQSLVVEDKYLGNNSTYATQDNREGLNEESRLGGIHNEEIILNTTASSNKKETNRNRKHKRKTHVESPQISIDEVDTIGDEMNANKITENLNSTENKQETNAVLEGDETPSPVGEYKTTPKRKRGVKHKLVTKTVVTNESLIDYIQKDDILPEKVTEDIFVSDRKLNSKSRKKDKTIQESPIMEPEILQNKSIPNIDRNAEKINETIEQNVKTIEESLMQEEDLLEKLEEIVLPSESTEDGTNKYNLMVDINKIIDDKLGQNKIGEIIGETNEEMVKNENSKGEMKQQIIKGKQRQNRRRKKKRRKTEESVRDDPEAIFQSASVFLYSPQGEMQRNNEKDEGIIDNVHNDDITKSTKPSIIIKLPKIQTNLKSVQQKDVKKRRGKTKSITEKVDFNNFDEKPVSAKDPYEFEETQFSDILAEKITKNQNHLLEVKKPRDKEEDNFESLTKALEEAIIRTDNIIKDSLGKEALDEKQSKTEMEKIKLKSPERKRKTNEDKKKPRKKDGRKSKGMSLFTDNEDSNDETGKRMRKLKISCQIFQKSNKFISSIDKAKLEEESSDSSQYERPIIKPNPFQIPIIKEEIPDNDVANGGQDNLQENFEDGVNGVPMGLISSFESQRTEETPMFQGIPNPYKFGVLTESFQMMSARFENVQNRFDNVSNRLEPIPNSFEDIPNLGEDVPNSFEDIPNRFEEIPNRYDDVSRKFDDFPNQANIPNTFKDTQNRFEIIPNAFNDTPASFNKIPNTFEHIPISLRTNPKDFTEILNPLDNIQQALNAISQTVNEDIPNTYENIDTIEDISKTSKEIPESPTHLTKISETMYTIEDKTKPDLPQEASDLQIRDGVNSPSGYEDQIEKEVESAMEMSMEDLENEIRRRIQMSNMMLQIQATGKSGAEENHQQNDQSDDEIDRFYNSMRSVVNKIDTDLKNDLYEPKQKEVCEMSQEERIYTIENSNSIKKDNEEKIETSCTDPPEIIPHIEDTPQIEFVEEIHQKPEIKKGEIRKSKKSSRKKAERNVTRDLEDKIYNFEETTSSKEDYEDQFIAYSEFEINTESTNGINKLKICRKKICEPIQISTDEIYQEKKKSKRSHKKSHNSKKRRNKLEGLTENVLAQNKEIDKSEDLMAEDQVSKNAYDLIPNDVNQNKPTLDVDQNDDHFEEYSENRFKNTPLEIVNEPDIVQCNEDPIKDKHIEENIGKTSEDLVELPKDMEEDMEIEESPANGSIIENNINIAESQSLLFDNFYSDKSSDVKLPNPESSSSLNLLEEDTNNTDRPEINTSPEITKCNDSDQIETTSEKHQIETTSEKHQIEENLKNSDDSPVQNVTVTDKELLTFDQTDNSDKLENSTNQNEVFDNFEVPVKTTKFRGKKGKGRRAVRNKREKLPGIENLDEVYCDICNRSFTRMENLVKHKKTLTHIAKLSEIEAREAEIKAKLLAKQKVEESKKTDFGINDILTSETSSNNKSEENVSFSLKPSNNPLNLVDIINDVLDKPMDNDAKFNDSYISSSAANMETKRYKSLGERKSFESDINTTYPFSTMPITNDISPKMSNATVLKQQLTILENIIERGYIDDITESSNKSSLSENKSDNYFMKPTAENFVKPPTHYEEISNDSLSVKNQFEEQSLRKVLNRDEALFLECCSLLKSSSEVSDFSKKSSKQILQNTFDMKQSDEPEWLESKTLKNQTYQSNGFENSCPNTPLGDGFGDEYSNTNSNTIATDWSTRQREKNSEKHQFADSCHDSIHKEERNFSQFVADKKLDDDCSYGSGNEECLVSDDKNTMKNEQLTEKNVAKFGKFMSKTWTNSLQCIRRNSKLKKKQLSEVTQTSITDYTVPLSKSDELDNKKIMTKGAMKVFEGLKVSIPTDELDLKELLNGAYTSKKYEEAFKEQSLDSLSVEDQPKKLVENKKNFIKTFGNSLGLKVTKKKHLTKPKEDINGKEKGEDEKKGHDVYDFEETQDNTDLFGTKLATIKEFRTKEKEKKLVEAVVEKDDENIAESESESQGWLDKFGFDDQSISSYSSESSNSSIKQTTEENITKKKCMIMGRIFKNAFKTNSVKDLPTIDTAKFVEDYVNFLPEQKPEKRKLSQEEMDDLFNKLLDDSKDLHKGKSCDKEVEEQKEETENRSTPKIERKHEVKKNNNKSVSKRKRQRNNSGSTDDEFSLNKSKKSSKKKSKNVDNSINLEQELRECIGVASRKSQRTCTSGKQNVLVEYWSSDDSNFEAFIRETMSLDSKPKSPEPQKIPVPSATTNLLSPSSSENKKIKLQETKPTTIIKPTSKVAAAPKTKTADNNNKLKQPGRRKSTNKTVGRTKKVEDDPEDKKFKKVKVTGETLAANRRKRPAADTLYYWSSSSEDESRDFIETKPIRDEIDDDDDDDDIPVQHGWIVGESTKKLVTMLAQAKGKKTETDCVKEQGRKRTTV